MDSAEQNRSTTVLEVAMVFVVAVTMVVVVVVVVNVIVPYPREIHQRVEMVTVENVMRKNKKSGPFIKPIWLEAPCYSHHINDRC